MFKMFSVLICGIIFGVALPGCDAGTYTILATKEIHSLSEYRVAVSRTADGQGAVNLEIEGKGYREAQLATLEGFSTVVVSFKTGVLNPGDHTLSARAVYGEEFFSKTPLVSMNKTYCVFLHTDKTVYEAGNVIMFRLVVLNKHLKPLANIKPGMILRDGNSHILKQWGMLPLTKGVFSEEIQIAEFPVLGDWSFEVEVNGQIYTKRILVADFVLPKFNLNIDAPEHVYYPDGSFPVTITARQFSGEEAEGELTITAYPVFYSGLIQPVFQAPLRRVEHLKGRLALQLSLGSELNLREGEAATGVGGGRGGRRLVLEASLEEALTGRRHNVSALLWLHRTRSYISYQAPKFYKPGLPYTIQVQVSDWENLDAQGNGRMMMKYGFLSGSEPMQEVTLPLDGEGRVTHTFYPDAGPNPSPMTIELLYNDLKEVISDIMPPPGPRENLMQLSLLTPMPEVGKEVHVKVNSTAPMKTLIYYVLGRGEIIFSKTFQIIPARRMDELKFQATHAMAPEAVLLVCHVSETSEMEIASIQFQVHGIFQNKVEVKLSPEQPEPLGNVDLRITAEPDSYVAVMAAAPSPMFSVASDHHYDAGQGDGLSVETVLAQVRSFSTFDTELKHLFSEIGSGVAGDIINQLGLALLSDNHFNKGTPELVQSRSTPGVRHDESTRPPLAGPYAFSRLPVPPSPRVHLGALPTNTWLFANITVGSEGKGLLGRRLPASPGVSWGVGAWAVHPVRGLGIAAPLLPRAPSRPTLRVAAPLVLREGEVLALPASLFNPTNSEVHADVTLHNTRQEFRFESNNELDAPKAAEPHQRQKLTVPPGRSGTVVFFISVPPLAGPAAEDPRTITLQLAATGVGLADSYEHEITILPAGEEESADVSDLLDMSTGSASANLSLPAPPRARARQRALLPAHYSARAWGWALAPALAALPERASLPPPSGYHNMLPYMDAAVLLQALDSSAQLSDSVKATCTELMHQIYQQQLAYLQADGSFSLHRSNYQEGSVWVTAFTTRWLGLGMGTARRDADVPAGVVRNALQWLAARQLPDGHWTEAGALPLEDALQQDPLVLTATTLFTFLDTKHLTLEEYSNLASKAQDWLARHVAEAGARGAAVLAPVAAALAAARHPAAFQATNILSSMANVTDGVRWWEINEQREGGNPLRLRGRSGSELSTVGWAAQALLLQGLRSEAAQLARALLGGLRAGPAPAPAPLLPALARLAQAGAGGAGGAATLEFRCPAGNDTTLMSVNKGNYLLVQEQQVRDKQCSVSAQGSGTVVASLKARRRTNVTAAWPRFSLDPRVDSISTAHHLQLTICVGFVTESGEDNSGPVLMEMRLPSGFDIDVDLPALLASGKVRSGHVGQTLRLVLAPLGPLETCLTLGAPRLHAVAKEHPGVITVTDLDDDSRRARVFFSPIGGSGLCDVCWGERCKGPCGDPARRPPPLSPRGQVGPSFFPDETAEEKSSAISVQPFALITTFAIVFSNIYIKMFGNN